MRTANSLGVDPAGATRGIALCPRDRHREERRMTSFPATAYRRSQIALHWFVMAVSWCKSPFMNPLVRETMAQYAATTPEPADATLAMLHGLIGTLFFLAVLLRLWLRFCHGVPGHAQGTTSVQAVIAALVHNALYACLLGMGDHRHTAPRRRRQSGRRALLHQRYDVRADPCPCWRCDFQSFCAERRDLEADIPDPEAISSDCGGWSATVPRLKN